MTVTEREEVSNAKIEQIKKDKEEQEEIDLLLNELTKDSDRQYVNADDEFMKDPDDLDEFLNALINEDLEEPKSSMKEDEDDLSQAKTPKRTRIAESDEAKTAQLRIGSGTALDPLEITMEIVSKYHDFVDYILQMLKEEGKDEEMEMQRWRKVLERGKHLVETLNQRLKRVPDEMERMKNDENLQKEYWLRKTHLQDILAHLRDINSRIDSSPDFSVVSNMKHREYVLPRCLDVLEYSKEELNELKEVIRELKEMEEDEEEDEEETE